MQTSVVSSAEYVGVGVVANSTEGFGRGGSCEQSCIAGEQGVKMEKYM